MQCTGIVPYSIQSGKLCSRSNQSSPIEQIIPQGSMPTNNSPPRALVSYRCFRWKPNQHTHPPIYGRQTSEIRYEMPICSLKHYISRCRYRKYSKWLFIPALSLSLSLSLLPPTSLFPFLRQGANRALPYLQYYTIKPTRTVPVTNYTVFSKTLFVVEYAVVIRWRESFHNIE